MEKRITLVLIKNETLECDKCTKLIKNQMMHLYIGVGDEVEEIFCNECWKAGI